jgi:SNF2 family DNA or RNA helicase
MRSFLAPLQPAVIHGSISREERESELARFRQDPECHVLLTNPQTLGEGISLHMTAHEAVFMDRTYNAAQYLQALDRIHRLGLPKEVKTTIHLLSSNASVDQRVASRLEVKIGTLSEMLDDPGLVSVSLPSAEELELPNEILGFDDLDLNELLEHLRSL